MKPAIKNTLIKNTFIHLQGNFSTGAVLLNGNLLCPETGQKLRNHSPDGFAWGYGGSGPAQLALSICLELFGEEQAVLVYQDFNWKFIAPLPQSDFDTALDLSDFIIEDQLY